MNATNYSQLCVPDLNNENFKAPKLQSFSFKQPLLLYLLKNASAAILRKLHSTCKLFVLLQKIVICKEFVRSFNCFSVEKICMLPENFKRYPKIFVHGTFTCVAPGSLSAIISDYLYLCEAETIFIKNQNLSISNFMFLLSKRTKTITLISCRIFGYPMGKILDNDEIQQLFKNLPNLCSCTIIFCCSNCERQNTSEWHQIDNRWICNACALFHRQHKLFPPIFNRQLIWTTKHSCNPPLFTKRFPQK